MRSLSPVSLADYTWLVGPEAAVWLKESATWNGDVLSLATQLRRSLTASQSHLILEQTELRRRAATKFAAASEMFFTPIGLEQATDEIVAAYKASRFPLHAPVADLCCGIGGDLLSLARRGQALAVDRDPIAALVAQANCRVCGLSVRVMQADVAAVSLNDVAAAHIDPDRRPQGRRTTQIEFHQPSQTEIESTLTRVPGLAIKLAPGSTLPDAWQSTAECEWISRDGQCKQLVAWFGSLASSPGQRRATVLKNSPVPARTLCDSNHCEAPLAGKIGRYLYEPDAAILAAGLQGVLANQLKLAAMASGIAYFTSDERICDPAIAAFEVQEHMPLDLKRLRGMLHQRSIGRLEIKKRGVTNDPETLRRRLSLHGDRDAVLVLTRWQGQTIALLCHRLASAEV